MGRIGKTLALFLILVAVMSCLTLLVKSLNAQTVPVLSIPQFTITFIPNYSNATITDPYTGANTTTTQNLSTINVTITNQQHSYSNGSSFNIYYNTRAKGHFDSYGWSELFPTTQLLPPTVNITQLNPNNYQSYEVPYIWGEGIVNSLQYLPQTNSTYTTVSIQANNYPSNGQIDIQVEAMLGVNSSYYRPANSYPYGPAGSIYPAIVYVTSSGWSVIKTINLTEGSVFTTPFTNPAPTSTPPMSSLAATPSTSPTVPELSWLVIVPLLVAIFSVAVVLRYRKFSKLAQ